MLIELRKKLATLIYGKEIKEQEELLSFYKNNHNKYEESNKAHKNNIDDMAKSAVEQIEAYNNLEDKYLTLSCKTSKTIISFEQKILAANNEALLSIREKDYNHKNYINITKMIETVNKNGINSLFSIYNTNKLDEYFTALNFDKKAIVHLQLLFLHKKALNEDYRGKYVKKRVERVKNHKCQA